MSKITVDTEILEKIEGLSDIERNMLNALIFGVHSINPSLLYEVITNEDEPEVAFREIGVNFYDGDILLAEVYCAEVVCGVTGEYQVTTFGDQRKREILIMSSAAWRIIEANTNPATET